MEKQPKQTCRCGQAQRKAVLINTKDIVRAFVTYNYEGYLPLMVKLRSAIKQNNLTTTTSVETSFTLSDSFSTSLNSCDRSSQLMKTLFDNKTTSVTEFLNDQKTIYVDRSILVATSVYMLECWQGQILDKNRRLQL